MASSADDANQVFVEGTSVTFPIVGGGLVHWRVPETRRACFRFESEGAHYYASMLAGKRYEVSAPVFQRLQELLQR